MQPSLSHSYVTVVPAYKAVPTDSEVLALAQLKRLSVENITLVCPNHLEVNDYLKLVPVYRSYAYLMSTLRACKATTRSCYSRGFMSYLRMTMSGCLFTN